jgi:hypothetical protein
MSDTIEVVGTSTVIEVNAPSTLIEITAEQGPQGPPTSTYAVDLEITDATKGLILRDANGTRYRVGLDTSGVLTVTTL